MHSIDNPELNLLRARVSALFEMWMERLHLDWMYVGLFFSDNVRSDDENCAMDTDTKWQYRSAKINVYLPAIAHNDDDDIELLLLHEFVHVMVNPMESLIKERDTDRSELAVENVARAIWEVHKRG